DLVTRLVDAFFVVENGERILALVRLRRIEYLRAPDQVVEHETAADRGPAAASLGVDVVDFLDLERGDVAVFGEPGRDARNLAPPVGRVALHFALLCLDDQIRRADGPRGTVGVVFRRRHVGRVPARRAAVGPL